LRLAHGSPEPRLPPPMLHCTYATNSRETPQFVKILTLCVAAHPAENESEGIRMLQAGNGQART
jgi:hypothetical protein